MQIKNIHINGFGKFHNLDIKYQKDLNTLLEDNGYGKTTIIDFLVSMFYGIGRYKKEDEKNPTLRRTKYAPWDQGSFGGTLEFNYNGKDYILERNFSPKSSTSDSVSIKELPSLELSKDFDLESIGNQIFKIDEEGFKQTLYIGQFEGENVYSSSVTGLLSAILGDADMSESTISKNLKDLEASIKSRFESKTNGELPKLAKQIQADEKLIVELKKDEYRIKEIELENSKLELELNEIVSKKNKIKELMKEYNKQANVRALKSQFDELSKDVETDKTNVKYLSKFDNDESYEEICKIQQEYLALKNNTRSFDVVNTINPDIVKDYENAKELITHIGTDKKNGINLIGLISTVSGGALMLVGVLLSILVSMLFMIMVGVGFAGLVFGLVYILKFSNKTDSLDADSKAELRVIFKKYKVYDENYFTSLADLATLVNEYNRKQAEIARCDEEDRKRESRLNELETYLNHLVTMFELDCDFKDIFTVFTEKRNLYVLSLQSLKEHEEKLNSLKEKMGPEISEINVVENYDELEQSLNELERESNEFVTKISANKEELRRINESLNEAYDKEEDLEISKNKLADLEIEKNIYYLTKNMLSEAIDESNDKYVGPIKDKIVKYLGLLGFDKEISLDKSIAISAKEMGTYHGINSYSYGTKDLIDFALRLAIIEAVYDSEDKPVIFMDDPFSELDEDNLKLATKLVKEISKKYQVFYFTCHKSRVL